MHLVRRGPTSLLLLSVVGYVVKQQRCGSAVAKPYRILDNLQECSPISATNQPIVDCRLHSRMLHYEHSRLTINIVWCCKSQQNGPFTYLLGFNTRPIELIFRDSKYSRFPSSRVTWLPDHLFRAVPQSVPLDRKSRHHLLGANNRVTCTVIHTDEILAVS